MDDDDNDNNRWTDQSFYPLRILTKCEPVEVAEVNFYIHVYIFCTARNQLISDEAYSFGDQFLNAEREERIYLVNKDTTAVSQNYLNIILCTYLDLFYGRKHSPEFSYYSC